MKKLKAYIIVPLIAIAVDVLSLFFVGKLFLRHEFEYKRLQVTGEIAPFLRAIFTDPWTIVFLVASLAIHVASLVVLIKAIRKEERCSVLILILRITNVVLAVLLNVLILSRLVNISIL